MAKLTKKQKALQGKVDSNKLYPLTDALSIVKECATAKFDESIDVAVQLGIDAKKSDQVVRGAVVMAGYWNQPEATADAIKAARDDAARSDAPEWFHTGDGGTIDWVLTASEWIGTLTDAGFAVEACTELVAPTEATTTYTEFAPPKWAKRWPAEWVWQARRR